MPFELPGAEQVDAFLPDYHYRHALDPEQPLSLNTVTLPDARMDVDGVKQGGYMDIRHNLHQEMRLALDVLEDIDRQFELQFGRGGSPLLDPYRCDDADYIVVAMGTLANQFHDVIERLREEDGLKVGVLAVQVYRPFPNEQVATALQGAKGVMVYEKGLSYGNQGALYGDVKSALYPYPSRPQLHNFIVGLGGREIPTDELCRTLKDACLSEQQAAPGQSDAPQWIGLQL